MITSEQVSLVAKIVRIYGFKGLMDYDTEVSASDLKSNPDFLLNLNKYTRDIDRLFPVHDINVRRVNYIIENESFAMNILRSLLVYIHVPWESRRTRDTIKIKLVDHMDQENTLNVVEEIEKAPLPDTILSATFTEPLMLIPRYNIGGYDGFININTKHDILSLKILSKTLHGYEYGLTIGGAIQYYGRITDDSILPAKYLPMSHIKYLKLGIYIFNVQPSITECLECEYTYEYVLNSHRAESGTINWPSLCWALPDSIDRCKDGLTTLNYLSGMASITPTCSHKHYEQSEHKVMQLGDKQGYYKMDINNDILSNSRLQISMLLNSIMTTAFNKNNDAKYLETTLTFTLPLKNKVVISKPDGMCFLHTLKFKSSVPPVEVLYAHNKVCTVIPDNEWYTVLNEDDILSSMRIPYSSHNPCYIISFDNIPKDEEITVTATVGIVGREIILKVLNVVTPLF